MSFIYDNLTAICVALVASAVAWIYGGTNAPVIAPVMPWMLLFMAEAVLLFPQKREGESTVAARERVWGALKHDPLVWAALALMILLAIPFVNHCLCPVCDAARITDPGDTVPPVKFLPYCVNVVQHYHVFLWFATALLALLAVRHGLRRRGRRVCLEIVVWNGFVLAIIGFVQIVGDAQGPLWHSLDMEAANGDFFSTFGYPNMAGDYFTTLFGIAAALWRRSNDDVHQKLKANHNIVKNRYKMFWRRHYLLIPTAVFLVAAIYTFSRAAMLLVSLLALVYFIHTFRSFTHHMHRAERTKKGLVAMAVTAVIVFLGVIMFPERGREEFGTLDAYNVSERLTGKGQYHVRVATSIWRDNFMFGCGGWGYKHFSLQKMREEAYEDYRDRYEAVRSEITALNERIVALNERISSFHAKKAASEASADGEDAEAPEISAEALASEESGLRLEQEEVERQRELLKGKKEKLDSDLTRAISSSLQMTGGANVHNDYLQFLAEHGLVGFALIVAIVWMLIAPVASSWRHLVQQLRFVKKPKLPPSPVQLFALPAPAFFILMTAVATFVHGFADCPLRSPAVLVLFFVSLASVPGFLPRDDE